MGILNLINIKKLHHSAYRCKDSEETRVFYEDFLGLPLVKAFQIDTTKSGRIASVLHSFYQLDDKSYIAFFEEPAVFFDFKLQRDFDLHIAFEVTEEILIYMFNKGKRKEIETRGIIDHKFIKSIYFRDPNGYVIELTHLVNNKTKSNSLSPLKVLNDWQLNKEKSVY